MHLHKRVCRARFSTNAAVEYNCCIPRRLGPILRQPPSYDQSRCSLQIIAHAKILSTHWLCSVKYSMFNEIDLGPRYLAPPKLIELDILPS